MPKKFKLGDCVKFGPITGTIESINIAEDDITVCLNTTGTKQFFKLDGTCKDKHVQDSDYKLELDLPERKS